MASKTLLYPIAKTFLTTHPSYNDVITGFNDIIKYFPIIINTPIIHEERNNKYFIKCTFKISAAQTISPIGINTNNLNKELDFAITPIEALARRISYSALLTGTPVYTIEVYQRSSSGNYELMQTLNLSEKNKYNVELPIPIGCSLCTTTFLDENAKIRSGNDFKNLEGTFIIMGNFMYIMPYYSNHQVNRAVCTKNNFENQLVRTDIRYSRGVNYEDTYYIVPVILKNGDSSKGRSKTRSNILEVGVSLQLGDPRIFKPKNQDIKIFNVVPIKYLFVALGCKTDGEMCKYISPDNDLDLINFIKISVNSGELHFEVAQDCGIEIDEEDKQMEIFKLKRMLDKNLARYVIGEIILTEDIKSQFRDKQKAEYEYSLISIVNEIFEERFMPNIPSDEDKCVELGFLVRQLYKINNDIEPQMDKASIENKRVRLAQQYLLEFKRLHTSENKTKLRNLLLSVIDSKSNKEIIDQLTNYCTNSGSEISSTFNKAFRKSMNTNPDVSRITMSLLEFKNMIFVWGTLREIVLSDKFKSGSAQTVITHRRVHPSTEFFICPTQSPEAGKAVGKYQQPTLYSYVSITTNAEPYVNIIREFPSVKQNTENLKNEYIIKVNGNTVGYIDLTFGDVDNLANESKKSVKGSAVDVKGSTVKYLYEALLDFRAANLLDASVILNHNNMQLEVWTDHGRLLVCFVCVKRCFNRNNGICSIKPEFQQYIDRCNSAYRLSDIQALYDEGIKARFIEMFDVSMVIYNAVIASDLDKFHANPDIYTHLALPMGIHGIVAGVNPAVSMNKGIRGLYSTNHTKQAIGKTIAYPQLFYLSEHNMLLTPQIPIVRTITYDLKGLRDYAYGCNCLVAFIIYEDNQEDSLIFNKSSINAGLFSIIHYNNLKDDIKNNSEEYTDFKNVNTTLIGNMDSYVKLHPNGIIDVAGSKLNKYDVIIGKTIQNNANEKRDISILCENDNTVIAVCDSFQVNKKDSKLISLSNERLATLGDKFTSEQAQKGVIGAIYDEDKLPYSATGVRPDIIFSHESLFKRETHGHVYIPMLGKLCALLGIQIDSTPYNSLQVDTIPKMCEYLNKKLKEEDIPLTLDERGYETLYDPVTGKAYKNAIFMGLHYYGRQRHMVDDKIQIRNTSGAIDPVTFQPIKGKKNNGGLSVDRMSSDAIISSGAINTKNDIIVDRGAQIEIGICNICKSMNCYQKKNEDYNKYFWYCPTCKYHDDFTITVMSPSTNIAEQYFNGLHLSMKLDTDAIA